MFREKSTPKQPLPVSGLRAVPAWWRGGACGGCFRAPPPGREVLLLYSEKQSRNVLSDQR